MGILAEFLSKIDFGVKWMLWGEQKIDQKNYPKNLILPQGKNWPKWRFTPLKWPWKVLTWMYFCLVLKWVDFVFFQIILVSSSAWYSSWFFVLVLFDPDREFCYGLRRSLGISSADKCAEKCRSASCCEAWQIRNKNECWTGIPVRCLQVISVHFKMRF